MTNYLAKTPQLYLELINYHLPVASAACQRGLKACV